MIQQSGRAPETVEGVRQEPVTAGGGTPLPRVLQVIAGLDPVIGGPPSSASQTALALRERGVEDTMAFLFDREVGDGAAVMARTLEEAGVTVEPFAVWRLAGRFAWRWGISLAYVRWLVRHARTFDVVHLHGAWTFTTFTGLVVARLSGRTAVLCTHESLTDFDRRSGGRVAQAVKWLLRRFYLRAFDLVVVSSELEQVTSGDPRAHVTRVVPHAVAPAAVPARRAHRGFVVGFLARLHPKKNLPLLLEAVSLVVAGDVTLVVAGDGPADYVKALHALADDLGVAERVTWLGFIDREQRADFLASVDVLAMPSEYECFGNAVVEALNAGVPVVVTANVGVSEVVARRAAGLVCSTSAGELAVAIARLAGDAGLRASMAAAARAAAAAEFSRDRHAERLLSAYAEAAGRPGWVIGSVSR